MSDPCEISLSPPGVSTYPSHQPRAHEAVSWQAWQTLVFDGFNFLRAQSTSDTKHLIWVLWVLYGKCDQNCQKEKLLPPDPFTGFTFTDSWCLLDSLFATQLNWDLIVKPLLRQERFDFNLSQLGFSNLFFFCGEVPILWHSFSHHELWPTLQGSSYRWESYLHFLFYISELFTSVQFHTKFFLLFFCHDICDLWLLCFMPQFFPSSHCDTADPIWMPHGHKTPTNLVSQLRGDSGASQELFFSTGVLPKENVRYYAMTQMKPELTRAASLQISRFNILSC